MFHIKVSPSLELWSLETWLSGGWSRALAVGFTVRNMARTLLGAMMGNSKAHEDVTRKLQDAQNLNSARLLPARCGGTTQQLERNLPILHAKSEANRQNLGVLLKWVPRGVQTLNDLQFITAPSSEEREVEVCPVKHLFIPSFSQRLPSLTFIPPTRFFLHTCLTPWLHLWSLSNCSYELQVTVALVGVQLAEQTKIACGHGACWTYFSLPEHIPPNKQCQNQTFIIYIERANQC